MAFPWPMAAAAEAIAMAKPPVMMLTAPIETPPPPAVASAAQADPDVRSTIPGITHAIHPPSAPIQSLLSTPRLIPVESIHVS
jgi:hypothetical protein